MIQQISPDEAYQKMNNETATYIDVRTSEEYISGHPKGSINIPVRLLINGFMQPNNNFINSIKNIFDPDSLLLIGCKTGGRSQMASEILKKNGFKNIYNIDGGFLGKEGVKGWVDYHLPVEKW